VLSIVLAALLSSAGALMVKLLRLLWLLLLAFVGERSTGGGRNRGGPWKVASPLLQDSIRDG
jgi:hypothetical protein